MEEVTGWGIRFHGLPLHFGDAVEGKFCVVTMAVVMVMETP